MQPRFLLALLVTGVFWTAACGSSDDTGATGDEPPPSTEPTAGLDSDGDGLSLVVLGDSVAAGEGIAYGYTYDYDADDPDRSGWEGGTSDPTWQGPYQDCHQDADAYGEVVAAALDAELAKFACTGATYLNGLTAPQTYEGTTYRPAQFGDWATKTDLNKAYDEAAPDVVVLTFGADDVSFTSIVEYCISGYTTSESAASDALAAADDVEGAIADALASRAPAIAKELTGGDTARRDDSSSSYCTAANPGKPIQKLFLDPIESGEIAAHYKDMVMAIQERGRDPDHGDGKVPEIVFTTYHRPLPQGLDGDCWDVWPLSGAEQSYLDSLQGVLQTTLEGAVGDMDGVTIADISKTMDGHRWCSEDPWVYGLSVYWTDGATDSQAPFHPTPEGQKAIAAVVEESVKAATGDG